MKFILILILFLNYVSAKNILLFNSYSSTLEWTSAQTTSILNIIKKNNENNIYIEYMDTKRFKPTLVYKQNYIKYLENKYDKIQFDVVILTDDNAMNFINRYLNHKLFKNSKIFFSGINNINLADILEKDRFAGIFEVKEPLQNYNLAKKLNNQLKYIYIVGDDSHTSNDEILIYKDALKDIKDVKFIYLNSNSIEKVLSKLNNYHKDSVMFMMAFTAFKNKNKNHNYPYKKVIKLISNKYHNPILVHTNIYASLPNTNIVGGYCSNGNKSGRICANFACSYIRTNNIINLGFKFKEGNALYLNEKNLKNLNISIDNIKTKNAIIVNKIDSLYEKYKLYINMLIAFIILNIIISLIVMSKNRELKNSKNELLLMSKYLQEDIHRAVKQSIIKEKQLSRKSKLESMGEMIINISHQWRQPLSLISTLSTTLVLKSEMGIMTNEMVEKDCTSINDKVQSLSKTIDKFTNFINHDTKKLKFDLEDNIHIFLDLVSDTININEIKMDINIHDDIIIDSYSNEFTQFYVNLFNNSVDAFLSNNIQNKYIKIDISKFNNQIRIIFQDNAGGIKEEALGKLYEPYFTTYHQTNGRGLGLNYVYNFVVNVCNGKIKAKNEFIKYEDINYKGALFEIILDVQSN